MSPARPRLHSPSFWPVDVHELLRFVLDDELAQAFVGSSCNRFFTSSNEQPPQVEIRRSADGAWPVLPEEWRRYFEAVQDPVEREELLVELSKGGTALNDTPSSLAAYLESCRSLSLDRTCSDDSILSFPPREGEREKPKPWIQGIKTEREKTAEEKAAKINIKNALKAGKSPKKEHEVDRFSTLVASLKEEGPLTHCVDVGSGRAHLSRALACPPLDLHVLAIDWSTSQKTGAERLDNVLTEARLAPVAGSLTHEVCSLDAEGVASALARWPPASAAPETPPALLVALHACGDLTPDAIKAFISVRQPRARAVFVGCCYNLQTPSLYPLSTCFRSLPPPDQRATMDRSHLRLTPQSPPTWHLSPASTAAWRASTLKLAYRARFEAELIAASPDIGPPETHRIGRVSECKSWETYRERAVRKLDDGELSEAVPELAVQGGEEGWETALFLLRVFWTLRSWLGPPLESLCVLDRFAYLCEGLEEHLEGPGRAEARRVELVNLFEQATGSLRNLALVVR